MTNSVSRDDFLQNLTDSGLFGPQEVESVLAAVPTDPAADGELTAKRLIADGKLTPFQAEGVALFAWTWARSTS